MSELLQIIAAYIVADAAAAIFHLATDCGLNTARVVAQFQSHHKSPGLMTFDLEPAMAGIVILLLSHVACPWFLAPLGVFISFGQMPHYFTHHPAPRIVRTLQRLRIFLPPESHASHHNGTFDRDYCVISGWNNWWINAIVSRSSAIKSMIRKQNSQ